MTLNIKVVISNEGEKLWHFKQLILNDNLKEPFTKG